MPQRLYPIRKYLELQHRDTRRERSDKVTAKQIGEALTCSESACYKYINGQHKLSASNLELLKYKLLGVIMRKGWDGFYFAPDERLCTPSGYSFNAQELEQVAHLKQIYYQGRVLHEQTSKELEETREALAQAQREIELLKHGPKKTGNILPFNR